MVKQTLTILALVGLLIVGCSKSDPGVNNNQNNGTGTPNTGGNTNTNNNQNDLAKALGCNCDPADFPGVTTPVFSVSPMKADDLAYIIPLGLMVKGHVTPIDHQYYYPPNILLGVNAPEYPVYSPADGYIVRVSRAPDQQVEAQLAPRDGYDILIQHSCNVYSYLGLLTSLPDQISAAVGTIARGATKDLRIKVSAGQQVARVGGQSLDLTVFDLKTPAKQWIVPTHYTEMGKGFKTDAFLYYTDAVKAPLLAKTIRNVEPKGGRFDYDLDAHLVGTWFLQGTNGYDGIPNQGNDYWRGHLVFAYFTMDPSKVEVSIGRWYKPGATDQDIKGGWQFSVKGNTPDPKDITEASGMVKYELTGASYSQSNGLPWDNQSFQGQITIGSGQTVEGVILVQLVGPRLLKVETFPGKLASEVTAFTANAQIYER